MSFELEQQHQEYFFDNGLPAESEFLDLPCDRFLLGEPDLNNAEWDSTSITYNFEHEFNNQWKFRQGFSMTTVNSLRISCSRVLNEGILLMKWCSWALMIIAITGVGITFWSQVESTLYSLTLTPKRAEAIAISTYNHFPLALDELLQKADEAFPEAKTLEVQLSTLGLLITGFTVWWNRTYRFKN